MITQENTSNFKFLTEIDPLFFQLAKNAELSFVSDPNTCLIKVRQLGEAIAQYIFDYYGLQKTERATQSDLIYQIDREIGIDQEIKNIFHLIRKLGNSANHEFVTNHRDALTGLKTAHGLAIWFYEAFNRTSKKVVSKAFIAPKDPSEKYTILFEEKEWRENKKIDLTLWKELKAKDVCTVVQSGSTPRDNPFDQNGKVPFLKVYNIVNNKINFDYKPQYITNSIHESKLRRSIVLPNDVLMNIVGPPLGKIAIVTDQFSEWNINQAITLFRADPEYLSYKFLYYFLCEGSVVRSVTHDLKGSVGQVNI